MPIKWDSKLSVGNSYIDTEHKLLIARINALEVILRHPEEKDIFKFFIDQLVEFARDHFYHEEQLQLKNRFPYYEENKQGHQQLMTDLKAMKDIIYCFIEKADATQEDATQISEQFNLIIRDWLINHIIKSDMKMKGYLDNAIMGTFKQATPKPHIS
jgi:hemerythrin